jgi:hypothetical protein
MNAHSSHSGMQFLSIIAGLALANRKVRENIERFGIDIYIDAMLDLLDRHKVAMGTIIQMIIPEAFDGKKTYFEDWIDDDGQGKGPYKIACHLHRVGEIAHFKFTGLELQSFSCGFSSIEELKSRRLKETRFQPPATLIVHGQYEKAAN